MILKYALLVISLLTLAIPAHAVYAQSSDDVQSLGDILNPPKTFNPEGKPITVSLLANEYYKTCVTQESAKFNEAQMETLCACSSANMSQNLSIQDFYDLEKPTKAGRDARGKAIAYGYVPCMNYVTDDVITRDCRTDPQMKSVVAGKKAVCKCTLNKFNDYLGRNGTSIIMDGLKYEPMTMNPLDRFFSQRNYKSVLRNYIKKCVYNRQYERNN